MNNKTKGLLLMSPILSLLAIYLVFLLRAGKGLDILAFVVTLIGAFLFGAALFLFLIGILTFFDRND